MVELSNNYLAESIGNVKSFLDSGNEVPTGLMMDFIYELKVSNLLIPAIDVEKNLFLKI